MSEIDHQMIEEFKIKRMKSITRYGRTRKPASVNRELAILSGIFRMAVDYEEIAHNPCRKVESLPEDNQRTRHLSFEEEDRLFAKLTGERGYLRPLVMVAIYAGPRRGELLNFVGRMSILASISSTSQRRRRTEIVLCQWTKSCGKLYWN